MKINYDIDIIRIVHESYHKFFDNTRDLIKEISIDKLESSSELIELLISFLNNVLRPYLTKWGVRFNEWYDKTKEEFKNLTPVEIQRKFDKYDELVKDLSLLNKRVISYSDKLKSVAFDIRKDKKQKVVN